VSAPRRIQRKRTKGWQMPEGAVYVGRPTRWGNPWVIGRPTGRIVTDIAEMYLALEVTAQDAAEQFAAWIGNRYAIAVDMKPYGLTREDYRSLSDQLVRLRARIFDGLPELRGRDLACWCPLDQPCHADTLLEIANR